MCNCFLRIAGTNFDVRDFLDHASFNSERVWSKGEAASITKMMTGKSLSRDDSVKLEQLRKERNLGSSRENIESGFMLIFGPLDKALSPRSVVTEVESFFAEHWECLKSFAENTSIERVEVEFSLSAPRGTGPNAPILESLFLPRELVAKFGILGANFEVTVMNCDIGGDYKSRDAGAI